MAWDKKEVNLLKRVIFGEVDVFVVFLMGEFGVIIVEWNHTIFEFVRVVACGINGGLFLKLDDIFVIHLLTVIGCYFLFIQIRISELLYDLLF